MTSSIVYGPVPSRRLGRSLGINNIPPKRCTYSCIYCQLGNTADMQVERCPFYKPSEIARLARNKVKYLREIGESVDYLAFVPDGEPTLDVNLGKEIELLRAVGIKIAVITNASLVWRENVWQDLRKADWVCLKVDAVTPDIWGIINRPHEKMKLDTILEGLIGFARTYEGELTTETMLIRGVNDDTREVSKIVEFLAALKPARAYIAIPTRPPAERVEPASERTINAAYQSFVEKLSVVEYLIGYEGNTFTFTGDVKEDLLSITAVHPMREDALAKFLEKAGTDWGTIRELIDNGSLVDLEYRGKKFYMRKMPSTVSKDSDRLSQNN